MLSFLTRRTRTRIHPAVGAQLVAGDVFPEPAGDITLRGLTCTRVQIDGTPPDAMVLPADAPAEQTRPPGWIIAGNANVAPRLLLNVYESDAVFRFRAEAWDLDAGMRKLTHQRALGFENGQAGWDSFALLRVESLPAGKLLVGVRYTARRLNTSRFLYDLATDSLRELGPTEYVYPDASFVFSVLPLNEDTAVAVHFSDLRQIDETRAVNSYNHLTLFSPLHPQGIEIVKLGVDQGNVTRAALIGQTLWIEAFDSRAADEPIPFVWTLDLSRLLNRPELTQHR